MILKEKTYYNDDEKKEDANEKDPYDHVPVPASVCLRGKDSFLG